MLFFPFFSAIQNVHMSYPGHLIASKAGNKRGMLDLSVSKIKDGGEGFDGLLLKFPSSLDLPVQLCVRSPRCLLDLRTTGKKHLFQCAYALGEIWS